MKDIINDNVQLFGSCHRVNPTSKHDRVDFGVLVSFFCRFLLLLLVLVSPNIMFCATLSCSSCRIHPRSAKTVTTCPKTNIPLFMEMNLDSILQAIPFSLSSEVMTTPPLIFKTQKGLGPWRGSLHFWWQPRPFVPVLRPCCMRPRRVFWQHVQWHHAHKFVHSTVSWTRLDSQFWHWCGCCGDFGDVSRYDFNFVVIPGGWSFRVGDGELFKTVVASTNTSCSCSFSTLMYELYMPINEDCNAR